MINDVKKSSEILALAINNLIQNGKLLEISKVLFDVNLESCLQSKLNKFELNINAREKVHEGAIRASVEYFLKRTNEICNDYQFATNSNHGVLSLYKCLEDNIKNENYILLYMLSSEIFLEYIIQMDEYSLKEFRIAEYLIPDEDMEYAIDCLFKRVQRISELTSNVRNNDDEIDDLDMPF